MGTESYYFSVIDGVIFAGMLIASALIGTYFAYKDRKSQSINNYFFGENRISPFPVGMSLSVSFMSAITIIGVPVEAYYHGTLAGWGVISWVMAWLTCIIYYIPLIHRLKLETINEYLELRYHRYVRQSVSIMMILQMILYMGSAIYIPSLALSTVTPLNLNWTIALTSLVCTFYTSIGGMKAVLWTDVLQGSLMVVGSLLVLTFGVNAVGINEIAAAVERGERYNLFRLDLDPRIKRTAWTLFIGYFLDWCNVLSCSQSFSQRCMSCKSEKSAKIAALIAIFPGAFCSLIAVVNGLTMFAFYEGCDPFLAGQISKFDQILPYFASEVFRNIPGITGLFVSAACSGTLSSISSGVNSLSGLLFMDFLLPKWPNMSERKKLVISKLLSLLFGVIVMLIAYGISLAENNVVEVNSALTGMVSGSVLAVYCMGMFLPWLNSKGALVGVISGWIMSGWLSLSYIFVEPIPGINENPPLSTENCSAHSNFTTATSITASYSTPVDETKFEDGARPLIFDTFYSISPFYVGAIGFLVCIVVGHIITFLTGYQRPSHANPDYFVPLLDNIYLPRKIRKFFRFGVPERRDISLHKSEGKDCELMVRSKDDE